MEEQDRRQECVHYCYTCGYVLSVCMSNRAEVCGVCDTFLYEYFQTLRSPVKFIVHNVIQVHVRVILFAECNKDKGCFMIMICVVWYV